MPNSLLPLRNGVKASYLFLPQDPQYQGLSLLAFLCAHFKFVPEQAWRDRLNSGFVIAQDGTILNEHSPYTAGEKIFYYREVNRKDEPYVPFIEKILSIDEHLIVVDKPHFLAVIPSGQNLQETLLTRLRLHPQLQHLNTTDITPIHRLDRDTAGVILFSHHRASRGVYQTLFQQRQVQKMYEAIAPTRNDLTYPINVASRLERDAERFYLTQTVTGEANAFTQIDLVENRGDYSRYRLYPSTGKKHQLRVHMMGLGMPLLNDGLYPIATPMDVLDFNKPLKLLAKSIAFTDPISGVWREFVSEQSL